MTTNTDALHRLAGVVGAYVDGEGLAVDIEGDGFYLRITDPAAADILAEPELQGATVSLSIFTGPATTPTTSTSRSRPASCGDPPR